MVYRKWVGTVVVSAAVGAGLMLLAVGARPPAGLEGWAPVNTQAAKALQSHEGPEKTKDEGRARDQAQDQPKDQTQDQTMIQTKVRDHSMDQAKDVPKAAKSSADGSSTGALSTAAAASQPPSAQDSSSEASGPSEPAGSVNINTAGLEELQNIPGIGAKKAAAIVDYRNQHGAFTKVADLTKVKGIGPKMLEKMKPYIGL
ncbi:helix-hairpin-helix domain-containing protein [Paenibacillus sp. YPG26]|uniref:ComEA family DNA-binding protein n=1 Tax=Paenibacillus sp. YPG26 TaxID=2878915 RepID=UPI00203A7949|nr:helix-hairpin-helix domain-containing protein [Paenibacillus sp. YPG26]USB34415.1 helix-hairpin-helix domain-containing protein [Paenibacillus sp. YPG26]